MEAKLSDLKSLCAEGMRMVSLTERIKSFQNWPYSGQMGIQQMAEAGWYQTGDLSTRHFITMRELDGWEGRNAFFNVFEKILFFLNFFSAFFFNFFSAFFFYFFSAFFV